jgi:5-methylcytosine-specific restriction endonuclease McrA
VFFRRGKNNGNYSTGNADERSYRVICFKWHDKKCIICGEDKIVDVHHMDRDHDNNSPENLIPLCPTHHKYMHSRHIDLIKDDVDSYIDNFKIK